MKTWKHGIIGIIAVIALAFIACDDGNGNKETEQPEYRTDTITFTFEAWNDNGIIYKAGVQGTMLLADWNNAKTIITTRINNAKNTTAVGIENARFNVFAESNNTVIIFVTNAGNGKLEVKDGEWQKLYINPSALNSITDEELITALKAMQYETPYKDNEPVHFHEWEYVVTTEPTLEADGEATQTCKTCGATSGSKISIPKLHLVDKTYTITLKDGDLVFTVAYKALATDEEPAYLAYIKGQFEFSANHTDLSIVNAVNDLLSKGNSFNITIKYGEPSFTGMNWNTAEQSFDIHNDWIATASGNNLSASLTPNMIRDAFNSVETE